MLRTRVISAIVLLALAVGPAIAGGISFLLLVLAAGLLAGWEYTAMLRQGGYHSSFALLALLTTAFIIQAQWEATLSLPGLLAVAVIGSLFWTLWHKQPNPITDWALALAGSLYLGWLLGHFIRLRALDEGLWWLLLTAVSVWAADISAYFVGRAIGRHPWWPRHSPKKTWEGYLAGSIGALLAAALLGAGLLPLPVWQGIGLGLLIGLLAPLGDLAESMIKRQVGVKDSSNLIPGHGGILDRIDSLLIAAPLVYYWAILVPR